MKSVWIILAKFKNGEVNTNEAYKTYREAQAKMYGKIEPSQVKTIDDWTVYDMENEILYTLKLVDIY